jgi:4-amino-4-deoxy-L-arabinose transferase-like glycosyltransferase
MATIRQRGATQSNRSLTIWVGTIVLILGAALRLAGFDEALIGADQGFILGPAAELVSLRGLPLVSVKSSVGMWQPATQAYIAGIALLVVNKVSAVSWLFSMLDVVAIAWLFSTVRRAIGARAALVSAALYATNPWVLEYVRWIHWHTLVSTFSTIVFGAYLLLVARAPRSRDWRLLAVGLFSATVMGTVHIVALPWAALLWILGLLIAQHRHQWRGVCAGAAASLLLLLPYLSYLLSSSSFDLSDLLALGTGGDASWNTGAIGLTAELITGRNVFTTPHTHVWADSVIQLPAVYDLLLWVFGFALAGLLFHAARSRNKRAEILMAICWSLLPIALYLRSSVHVQHFYLHYLFPAPFVGLGIAVQLLAAKGGSPAWRRAGRSLGYVLMALALGVSVWWASHWAVRIRLEQEWRIGVPTRAWVMDKTIKEIERYLTDRPECEVVILTAYEGERSPYDWVPSFMATDLVRVVPAGKGVIVPPSCACYLLGLGASIADLGSVGTHVAECPGMALPARLDWSFRCIDQRPEYPPALAEWENGLSLLDAVIEGEIAPGGTLQIVSTWHYREVAPQQYHFFNHLFCDGRLVTQVDGPGVPAWYWRDDDILETRFPLVLPGQIDDGEYELRVGVYGWPDLRRVQLTDGGDGYEVEHWSLP